MATGGGESVPRPPSPEVQQNQSPPRETAPWPGNNEEKRTHLRFLISQNVIGFIKGYGGSTIQNIRSQSGAHVLSSRKYEYFPGTQYRIMMILGTIGEISHAFDLVVSKLLDKFYSKYGGAAAAVTDIFLIVPHNCCGKIIGTGGDIIKSLINDSGAHIRVWPKYMSYPDFGDRLVTVNGTLDKQMAAIVLMLEKLKYHPYYNQQSAYPIFPYAVQVYVIGGMHQNNLRPNRQEDSSCSSVTIGIADEHVELVMGRRGCVKRKISKRSGAKITISDRGDFISGTSNRKVTITGSESAINSARSMILKKVPSVDADHSE